MHILLKTIYGSSKLSKKTPTYVSVWYPLMMVWLQTETYVGVF
jgi:hypothetical protein